MVYLFYHIREKKIRFEIRINGLKFLDFVFDCLCSNINSGYISNYNNLILL